MSARLFLIAGEESGDLLGADLMAGIKRLDKGARFEGIGGRGMKAEGLESGFSMSDLSVSGIHEVAASLPLLLRRKREAVEMALGSGADALVTIDSPDFCLRVAREVKSRNPAMRTIHYVAPSVWAWRKGRARKMARYIDHVLALLPFESRYMMEAGMGCDFVGHPAAKAEVPGKADSRRVRARLGIDPGQEILCVLPGSRGHEVDRLAPAFGKALEEIDPEGRGMRVAAPTTPEMAARVSEITRGWPVKPALLVPEGRDRASDERDKRALFLASRLALAASGTVALELASTGTPMVLAYNLGLVSRLVFRFLLDVDAVNLVDIVNGSRTVPEFIGKDCDPGKIARGVIELLDNPEKARPQLEAGRAAMRALGQGDRDAALLPARSVLKVIS